MKNILICERWVALVLGLTISLCTQSSFAGNIDDTDHGGMDWIITNDTDIAGIHKNIRLFRIENTRVVTVKPELSGNYGFVEIHASTISIIGTLTARGSGYKGGVGGAAYAPGGKGSGPGAGAGGHIGKSAGAGAGYGGKGGNSSSGEIAGNAYGQNTLVSFPSSFDDIEMGSGGGGGFGAEGGNFKNGSKGGHGGGMIMLISSYVFVSGELNASGQNGLNGENDCCISDASPGGGGSGGGILIYTKKIDSIGSILNFGGTGGGGGSSAGSHNAGGGAGGRIKIFYEFSKNISVLNLSGGSGGGSSPPYPNGNPGSNGTIYYNQIPSVPQPLFPANNSAPDLQVFDWTDVQDNEGPGFKNYEFQVSSNTDFNPVFYTAIPAISEINVARPLPVIYYWRVRSFDGEVYSDWSDPWTVIGDTVPPVGIGIDSLSPNISSVTVNLLIATDMFKGLHAQPYWVDASTSPTFSPLTASAFWQTSNVWKAEGLSPDTIYYFRTKARDANLNETPWASTSTARTLPTPDTTPPSGHGIASMDSHISSVTITLSAASDPGGLAAKPYWLDTSTSSDFTPILFSSDWIDTLTWEPAGLSQNSTYYFRVKARDTSLNESPWTSTTVVKTLPAPLQFFPPEPLPEAPKSVIGNAFGFPNPSRGSNPIFRVESESAERMNIRIYNLAGELVTESDMPAATFGATPGFEWQWNTDGVAPGIYQCVVTAHKDGQAFVKRFRQAVKK